MRDFSRTGQIDMSVELMTDWYDMFNRELFGGKLGECNFEVKKIGTQRFGDISMQGQPLQYSRYDRRLYTTKGGNKIYINRENFYRLAKPLIRLNSSYKCSEFAWATTLVHEMCHYYTFMDGRYPKQGHGKEFKAIASHVNSISQFHITTYGDLSERELDDEAQRQVQNRRKNRINSVKVMFVRPNNESSVKLFITKADNESLIDRFYDLVGLRWGGGWVYETEDNTFIEKLFNVGYKRIFKTIKWWEGENVKKMLDELIQDDDNGRMRLFTKKYILNTLEESRYYRILEDLIHNEVEKLKWGDDDIVTIDPNMNLSVEMPD